eukprot:CAMPEP_0197900542 /NCGR_PEP_ID=MMETSP1439-20131203/49311_1 /TAXON_ID=66791 /ORGANISM="Gonyaulax spinifera, Strain CCMP409" /LENGTH=655 /DNA_ID=CAMNT_0043521433 /DNA_START=21 /DNA_END=1988 /DNA_ORIENTATION=-
MPAAMGSTWPDGVSQDKQLHDFTGIIRPLTVACLAVSLGGLLSSDISWPYTAHLTWVAESKTPFMIIGSIFATQAVMSVLFILIMGNAHEIVSVWGVRFQHALRAHAAFSTLGAILYIAKYVCSDHWVIHLNGHGEYLFGRHLHWVVSTPTQWYVFSLVSTRCSTQMMTPIYEDTVFLQIHGILMLMHTQTAFRWFSFTTSCLHCFCMFWRILQLPLVRDMVFMGHRIRLASLAIWNLYPLLILLRWAGVMDDWSEQVLFLSILDILAKVVTFSAIVISRIMLVMAQINGTVQLVLASQDVTVAVDDCFCLIDSPDAMPLFAPYFAHCTGQDDRRLLELCINEEHQERLMVAARRADAQDLGAPTPKVSVALRMPTGGGEMLVDCLVSKCLHGQRMIGFAVASQSGDLPSGPLTRPGAASVRSTCDGMTSIGETVQTEISCLSDMRNYDMQMILALHNCNDVLELQDPMRSLVKRVFLQSHTSVLLFVWDASAASLEAMVVVTSPHLQGACEGATPPQPLSLFLGDSMVDKVMGALSDEDYIMHQWSRVAPYAEGAQFKLSVLPLNRFAGSEIDSSNAQLNLAVLETVERVRGVPLCEGYHRWAVADDRTLELDSHANVASPGSEQAESEVAIPPRILAPLLKAYLLERAAGFDD